MDIHIPSVRELLYKARQVMARKEWPYRDKDLTYAAYNRCPCGAGIACLKYANPYGPTAYWDCSAILKNEAIPSGQPGSVIHTAQLPFTFYEIKSENQPSANGATTRPC